MNDKNKNRPDQPENKGASSLSRRGLLKGAGLTGAAFLSAGSASGIAAAADTPDSAARIPLREAFETLTAAESAALDALASRILPSDDGSPGAHEARAVHYIDRALAGPLAGARQQYTVGLAALDALAMARSGTPFARLSADAQDAIIEAMTENTILDFPMLNAGFFNTVRNHTIDGCFSDPYYGGNRDFVGWDLIGYPGVRHLASPEEVGLGRNLAPSRQSAYDMETYTKDPVSAQQGGSAHGQ